MRVRDIHEGDRKHVTEGQTTIKREGSSERGIQQLTGTQMDRQLLIEGQPIVD